MSTPSEKALAAAEEIGGVHPGRASTNYTAAIIDKHMAPKPVTLENPLWQIIEEMEAQGGDFIRKLAAAMRASDSENMARIIKAFSTDGCELIQGYDAKATLRNKDAAERNGTGPDVLSHMDEQADRAFKHDQESNL